jgi:dolichol-phosphate mannosyltransferase
VLDGMVLRKDWHRYMVALAADQGYRIHEIKVRLRPRRYGKTKYGFWRIPVGFLDLLAVKFRLSFMSKPLLLFGSIGIVLFATGFLVGCYALYLRFVLQHGYRPLAYLVTLLVVSGLILFAVGFLAEVMADIRGRLDGLERKVKERSGEE